MRERAPRRRNRGGMDDGMESPAVLPNKSCVRLGRVNARLRRRRSISRTPHTPVSTIVVRATRRVASRRQQIRVLFTVSSLRLGTEPNVQWRSIFFQMIVELGSTRERTNLVYQWGGRTREHESTENRTAGRRFKMEHSVSMLTVRIIKVVDTSYATILVCDHTRV